MNILSNFPSEQELLAANAPDKILEVSGHFHTPFSFSAFKSIVEVFEMAKKERISVLGINDFYTTAGFSEFYNAAIVNNIFPLFNIEFIGLIKEFQESGIRVNDPDNPGRVYFSGKGLAYPVKLNGKNSALVDKVINESQVQIKQMVEKINILFATKNIGLSLSYETIRQDFAKELVRERHLAKAIRVAIMEKFQSIEEIKTIFQKLYAGKEPKADFSNFADLENEIRSNLLKKGGAAFVPEDPQAFPDLGLIREIILDAKGIPCYPVLLDDKNGKFTDFEGDKQKMYDYLCKIGVFCIELIPGRNKFEILKEFVEWFDNKGFIITLGTEHNSPVMVPLTVNCSGNVPLDDNLRRISYEGACVIAAHQYLIQKGENGYVDNSGYVDLTNKKHFVKLGKAIINHFISNI